MTEKSKDEALECINALFEEEEHEISSDSLQRAEDLVIIEGLRPDLISPGMDGSLIFKWFLANGNYLYMTVDGNESGIGLFQTEKVS